jgi:trans-2,3-dihydro-3-hydroxyanthranilate isomerase
VAEHSHPGHSHARADLERAEPESGDFVGHPYEIWDVFTDTPLQGNPLGVFPRAEEMPSRLYQQVARELNLSETVFIAPDDPREAEASIRIFTPTVELPFAGHPTLGAAYAIAAQAGYATVRLRTGSGILTVAMSRNEHGEITHGAMRQPVPTVAAYAQEPALLAALGVTASVLPVEMYTNGPSHVVVAVADRATLSALAPDMSALTRLGEHGVAVIAVGDGRELYSRNFCPGLGVPEDPATGSAAGPVAVHLLRHGLTRSGETVEITQGVEMGRPSRLLAAAIGSPGAIELVTVAGSAVRVATGHYRLA